MRLQQWIKNTFLFAALIFSGHLFVVEDVLLTFFGFITFSLAASAIYIYNDLKDVNEDKLHPVKSLRPIPAGNLSLAWALGAAIVLAVAGLVGSFALSYEFGLIAGLYVVLNIAYSIRLKRLVILDVMTIAGGFVLRVVGGAVLIRVPTSEWLIICTILLSLFLGFSKRRSEIVGLENQGHAQRSVLVHYSPHFLDQMIGIVTATTVMSYALYTISEETVMKFGTKNLIFTVPFVLYGIFRYLYLVHKKEEGGDPTKTILTDGPLLVNVLLWIAAASWIIYGR